MGYDAVVRLASEALMLCVVLSLPAVAVSALVGLMVSFLQAVTSLQDQSISQGVKLLVVSLVVVVSAPWAGSTLMRFSENLFEAVFAR
jgi:type III secretion protein S